MPTLKSLLRPMYAPGFLRFILALTVVFAHSFRLNLGAFAVRVFFVLSGYWIAEMWEKQYRLTRRPYLSFAISRYWRIAPLYFLCMVLALAVMFRFSVHWNEIRGELGNPWSLLSMAAFFGPLPKGLLGPSWTLAIEWRFYLLAPLILELLAFHRQSRMRSALIFGTIVGALYVFRDAAGIYVYFLIGMAAQHFRWKPSLAIANLSLGAFLLVGVFLSAIPGRHFPDEYFLLLVVSFSGYAVFTVHQPSSPVDRALGNFSFTIYLFHWVAFSIMNDAFYNVQGVGRIIGFWGLTAVGSVGIYFCFEGPVERLRRKFVKSRKQLPPARQEARRELNMVKGPG